MKDRPPLRLVHGGRCPPALQPGLEREVERRLKAIAEELTALAYVAEHDLGDDLEVPGHLLQASAGIARARGAIARRKA